MVVSAEEDVSWFLRRHDEDQHLFGKCVFPCLFLMRKTYVHVVCHPLPFPFNPSLSIPTLSVQVLMDESCFNYYLSVVKIISPVAFYGLCRVLPRGRVCRSRRKTVL